jgi:hypothetical protein
MKNKNDNRLRPHNVSAFSVRNVGSKRKDKKQGTGKIVSKAGFIYRNI